MTIFTIDSENNIAAHGAASEITDKGSEQFTSEKELAQLAADWPGSRLVDIWNRIPGLTPVKRFTNRAVATARISTPPRGAAQILAEWVRLDFVVDTLAERALGHSRLPPAEADFMRRRIRERTLDLLDEWSKEAMELANSKDGGWVYTERCLGGKNANPG